MVLQGSAPRRILPVWLVVRLSYGFLSRNFAALAIPLVVVFIFSVVGAAYRIEVIDPQSSAAALPRWSELLSTLITIVAVSIPGLAVIVGIHRFIILGETRSGTEMFRFDRNLVRYIGTFLLVGLSILGIILAFWALAAAVILLGYLLLPKTPGARAAGALILVLLAIPACVALGGTMLRLSLALPAAAIGDVDPISRSWRITKGNTARLFGVGFLSSLPFILLSIIALLPDFLHQLAALQAGDQPGHVPGSLTSEVLIAAVQALELPILTAVISYSYDALGRGADLRRL